MAQKRIFLREKIEIAEGQANRYEGIYRRLLELGETGAPVDFIRTKLKMEYKTDREKI